MKNTSIILFIVLLSLTVCSENVKADNNLSAQKEQEINLFEGVFRFAEEILGLAGDIITLGQKDKGTKVENTSIDKPVVKNKQEFDIIESLHGLAKDAVNFSWEIITLGYDEEEHDYYQEWPTYQQWQNVEAASFFGFLAECLANSVVGNGL